MSASVVTFRVLVGTISPSGTRGKIAEQAVRCAQFILNVFHRVDRVRLCVAIDGNILDLNCGTTPVEST